jgi:hypothetical protein
MQARNWLLTTISLILGAAGALVGFNITMDVYGLYHSSKGQRLLVYGDPRVAKYLLNQRYVPENFNAIMLGSSVTANWDLTAIEGLRVYNDSVNGGNIIEEKAILESALSRKGISNVLLLVHPALTSSHDYKTVDLNPRLKLSALGSLSLWEAYKDVLKIRLRRAYMMFDYAGTENFGVLPNRLNPTMKALWRPGGDFDIDPIALAAYREVIARLHARRVNIIFVVPPTFEDLLRQKPGAFERYVRLIQAAASPADKWIDFTSEAYADFRRVSSNFSDGSHLVPPTARQVVLSVNAAVNDWIAKGQLVVR